MSLVGPRPPLLDDLNQYGPHENTRLQVRPGLTGWAQIHGRNALPWPARIEHDVWYVRNRSFLLDLRILARTPLCLIRGRGVYGPGGQNPSFSSVSSDHA
jgi:lipopolysaccharide/colanic/teichoic acid biosynthesis glycosyltransferase